LDPGLDHTGLPQHLIRLSVTPPSLCPLCLAIRPADSLPPAPRSQPPSRRFRSVEALCPATLSYSPHSFFPPPGSPPPENRNVFRMVPSAGARIHYGFRSESHWPPSTSNPPERDPSPPLLCPLCWAIRPADTGHIILRRSLPPLPSPRSLLEPVMLPIRPLTLPSFCRQATQSTRE